MNCSEYDKWKSVAYTLRYKLMSHWEEYPYLKGFEIPWSLYFLKHDANIKKCGSLNPRILF